VDQKPKATKWTCSKAGTKLSDVQKASREKRGFQGSRRGQSPGDAFVWTLETVCFPKTRFLKIPFASNLEPECDVFEDGGVEVASPCKHGLIWAMDKCAHWMMAGWKCLEAGFHAK
jgi:hypothetical protein